jgi:hypothetical protein
LALSLSKGGPFLFYLRKQEGQCFDRLSMSGIGWVFDLEPPQEERWLTFGRLRLDKLSMSGFEMLA